MIEARKFSVLDFLTVAIAFVLAVIVLSETSRAEVVVISTKRPAPTPAVKAICPHGHGCECPADQACTCGVGRFCECGPKCSCPTDRACLCGGVDHVKGECVGRKPQEGDLLVMTYLPANQRLRFNGSHWAVQEFSDGKWVDAPYRAATTGVSSTSGRKSAAPVVAARPRAVCNSATGECSTSSGWRPLARLRRR